MAWSRTSAGLMAFGFLIDRSAVMLGAAARTAFAFWIGLGFVLLGVLLSGLSIVQYRRAVTSLKPVEIPPGYWVHLAEYASAAVGLLGCALALYLVIS